MSSMKDYVIGSRIAGGAFGDVHECEQMSHNTVRLVAKIEKRRSRSQLRNEYRIIQAATDNICRYVPRLFCFGSLVVDGAKTDCLVMERLHINLEEMRKLVGGRIHLPHILSLGVMMIERIEWLHRRRVIHRDVKPENFMFSRYGELILIDFGLAKFYCEKYGVGHIPMRTDKALTGTARFASIATHEGIEQCRRDDLESMYYSLIYLAKGALPWQGLAAKTKSEKYGKIKRCKLATELETLCAGLPRELIASIRLVRAIGFEEAPDYAQLKKLMIAAMDDTYKIRRNPEDWVTVLRMLDEAKKRENQRVGDK